MPSVSFFYAVLLIIMNYELCIMKYFVPLQALNKIEGLKD